MTHEHVYRKEKPRRWPASWGWVSATYAKCSCGKLVRLDELVYLAAELPKSRQF